MVYIENSGRKEQALATYIFYTTEGYTYQPNSEAMEPDIENLQVLGFAAGETEEEAFKNLLDENEWLLETTFDQVRCIELKYDNYNEHIGMFSIRSAETGRLT